MCREGAHRLAGGPALVFIFLPITSICPCSAGYRTVSSFRVAVLYTFESIAFPSVFSKPNSSFLLKDPA